MASPNRFTKMLHTKNLKVNDFLDYWGITRRTYERWCADDKSHCRLIKLINGMESKNDI